MNKANTVLGGDESSIASAAHSLLQLVQARRYVVLMDDVEIDNETVVSALNWVRCAYYNRSMVSAGCFRSVRSAAVCCMVADVFQAIMVQAYGPLAHVLDKGHGRLAESVCQSFDVTAVTRTQYTEMQDYVIVHRRSSPDRYVKRWTAVHL